MAFGFEILGRGVSIDRLETFCRVVEAGSLTAAAGGNTTRQSQYSRQIKQLEDGLEKRLFVREGKSLKITEDGRKLALMTTTFFASLEEFAFGAQSATVRIGAGESVLESFVYPRFQVLRDAMPGYTFEFVSLSTAKIVEALKTGHLEMGMVRADADTDHCRTESLGVVEFELVVPRSILPQREISALDQLRDLPIATLSGTGRFVHGIEALANKRGFELKIVARADSFSKIGQIVRSGNVAGFLPTLAAASFDEQTFARFRDSSFSLVDREINLAVSETTIALRPALGRGFEALVRAIRG